MLRFLGDRTDRASDRRLLLFAVACGRRVWASIGEPGRRRIEFLERYVEGKVTRKELTARGRILQDPWGVASRAAANAISVRRDVAAWEVENQSVAALLRDIFGNPFRPVTVQPSWLTGDVVTLAQGFYQERHFEAIPILADALEESGCTNPDILAHCRFGGHHVRGCWVVDMILGKA
jgi:hypothetical protein